MASVDLIRDYFETVKRGMLEIYPDMQELSYEIKSDRRGIEATFYGPDHIEFAERGRGPGGFPPPNKIKDWLVKEGIKPDGDMTLNQLAYVIGRKMSLEGSKLHRENKKSGVLSKTITEEGIKELFANIAITEGTEYYSRLEKLFG